MLRTLLCLSLLSLFAVACATPPVPPAPLSNDGAQIATNATLQPTAAAPTTAPPATAMIAVVATAAPPTAPSTATSALSSAARTTLPSVTLTRVFTPTASLGLTGTRTITVTNALTRTQTPAVRATPRPRPTTAPGGPAALTPLITGQVVTAMYMNEAGDLYYGVAASPRSIADAFGGDNALWKLPANGAPMQLTPFAYNQIGGITTHGGWIYFSEAGALRRIRDADNVQQAEAVIIYPMINRNQNLPYGHMNNSLAKYVLNGQEVLLMGVGSILDSSFPGQGVPANIQPPYYEDFPTGRINYAAFDWLDATREYVATQGVSGKFEEFARGVRNPWAMTVGTVDGQTHIFAVDNDPAFTPEKYDSNPANSGDELNDIKPFTIYGHPYLYGGAEPALGFAPPVVTFPDGAVPSGIAIAADQVFVGLHDARMVVKVDLARRTFTPVLTGIEPFNLLGVGNLLYVADFDGIYVIDARGL